MATLEMLQQAKAVLCKERDSLADLYTEYIQKLILHEKNLLEYDFYVQKITELEPATRDTKERMRELNRQIDSLQKTQSS